MHGFSDDEIRDAFAEAEHDDARPGRDFKGASWRALDLAPYLNGTHVRPTATLGLARRDGLRLLYPGKEHTVIGEMESGKSWFAAGCVAAELDAGNLVIYVHFEEADPSDTLERLQLLGVDDTVILSRFTFVGPDEPVDPFALAVLLDPAPSLVVLDGVNEAMSMHAMGIRDEDGAAAFRRRLVKPCTAVGAATLGCDHVVKDREKRGRDPLGSIHKGNGLTGSLILLENATPFGRGDRGCSYVFVTKDRPGYLRRSGRPNSKIPGKTFMGSMIVDDTRTWVLSGVDLAFIEPAEIKPDQPHAQEHLDDERVMAAVISLEADGKQPTLRTVRVVARGDGEPISNVRVDDALVRLTLAGRVVESSGPNRSRLFSSVPEHLDEVGAP